MPYLLTRLANDRRADLREAEYAWSRSTARSTTRLIARTSSGPERAPRDAVLSDLRERGFDADLARLANGGDIRATAVVRSAARFLSRALLSRARRDAV